MKEKIQSARCPIHGSRGCEVFRENKAAQIKKRNKISRLKVKKAIEQQLREDG